MWLLSSWHLSVNCLLTLYIGFAEFPVSSWIGSDFSAHAMRINRRLCTECVKKNKKKLWSFSTKKAFKALMCFVSEWPVDLVGKSVVPVVASVHRQVYLQKQLPLCLTDPTPLLSTLDQRSEIARWLLAFVIVIRPSQGQRCQHYDSQTRSACWSLSLSEMLLHPPTFNHTPPFSPQTLKSVWTRWGSPSCLPPLPPPAFTASFSPSAHKETLPHLDCLYAVAKTETAAGCECQRGVENWLRLSGTLREIAK